MSKMMKKRKLQLATKRRPVKSHVIVAIPKYDPVVVIANYRGNGVLVCYRLKAECSKGFIVDILAQQIVECPLHSNTLINEYGSHYFATGKWYGGYMYRQDLKDAKMDTTEKIYKYSVKVMKHLKASGILADTY